MAERVLVPIDQKLQVKSGWSKGFANLDVELRSDNPETRGWIDHELIRGLHRLGGCVLNFSCEFPSDAIPPQFRREGVFDLSLGAKLVRLTTGKRVKNSVNFDERDTLYATAGNLGDHTWVFDAKQIQEYVPPTAPEPTPPFRLRDILRPRGR